MSSECNVFQTSLSTLATHFSSRGYFSPNMDSSMSPLICPVSCIGTATQRNACQHLALKLVGQQHQYRYTGLAQQQLSISSSSPLSSSDGSGKLLTCCAPINLANCAALHGIHLGEVGALPFSSSTESSNASSPSHFLLQVIYSDPQLQGWGCQGLDHDVHRLLPLFLLPGNLICWNVKYGEEGVFDLLFPIYLLCRLATMTSGLLHHAESETIRMKKPSLILIIRDANPLSSGSKTGKLSEGSLAENMARDDVKMSEQFFAIESFSAASPYSGSTYEKEKAIRAVNQRNFLRRTILNFFADVHCCALPSQQFNIQHYLQREQELFVKIFLSCAAPLHQSIMIGGAATQQQTTAITNRANSTSSEMGKDETAAINVSYFSPLRHPTSNDGKTPFSADRGGDDPLSPGSTGSSPIAVSGSSATTEKLPSRILVPRPTSEEIVLQLQVLKAQPLDVHGHHQDTFSSFSAQVSSSASSPLDVKEWLRLFDRNTAFLTENPASSSTSMVTNRNSVLSQKVTPMDRIRAQLNSLSQQYLLEDAVSELKFRLNAIVENTRGSDDRGGGGNDEEENRKKIFSNIHACSDGIYQDVMQRYFTGAVIAAASKKEAFQQQAAILRDRFHQELTELHEKQKWGQVQGALNQHAKKCIQLMTKVIELKVAENVSSAGSASGRTALY